jgi:uncharacterized protein YkwD
VNFNPIRASDRHNNSIGNLKIMRLRILSCLLLLAVSLDAAASDLYTVINRLRAGGGHCAVAKKLPPLTPQDALERVARDLSQGDKLEQSLREVGYQAARSSAFSIKGDVAGAKAAGMLAKQSSCRELQQAAMTEVGIYQDARQVWIVMAAPFAPSVGPPVQASEQRVLDLINQARATARYCGDKSFNSVRPVRWNGSLAEASRLHAEEMARYDYFSHSGRDGSNPWDRIERAGYRWRSTGENIAAGQRNAEEAVASWIKSPEHCANLMNPKFTEMGFGFGASAKSEMGLYWAQAFGTPR